MNSDEELNQKPQLPMESDFGTTIDDSTAGGSKHLELDSLLARIVGKTSSFSGRYQLRGEIARGGMGSIQRVFDRSLNRVLAMKVIHSKIQGEWSKDRIGEETPIGLLRFLEEAQITAQLVHPGIVPVHDLGLDAHGAFYFTMHLVKGFELSKVSELVLRKEEGWNLSRAIGTLVKAGQALAYAHEKGVIHRDLKPSNIMVGPYGEVFVMDWGLAKLRDRADLHDIRLRETHAALSTLIETPRSEGSSDWDAPVITMDGAVIGTPAFMSPEQASGHVDEIDMSSDVYSMGAILYHLLTGHPPYLNSGVKMSSRTILGLVVQGPPRPVLEDNSEAPAELVAICSKAMAREKTARYPSSREFAEDLQAWLDHRVVKAYQTGAVAEAKKWFVRNPALATTAAIIPVILIAGLMTVLFVQDRAQQKISRQLRESRNQQAWLTYAKGEEMAKSGEVADGLLWMAESLRVAPPDLPDFDSFVRSSLTGWSAAVPKFVKAWGEEWAVTSIAFNPVEDFLALGTREGEVRFEALGEGVPQYSTLRFEGRMVKSLDFSPDGDLLAIGLSGDDSRSNADADISQFDSPSSAYLWNRSTQRQLPHEMKHDGAVAEVGFSPDGSKLLTREYPGIKLRFWDVSTGNLAQSPIDVDRHQMATTFRFSSDGEHLMLGMKEAGAGKLINVNSFEPSVVDFGRFNHMMTFHPEEGLLVVTEDPSFENEMSLVNARTGQLLKALFSLPAVPLACEFTPDGRHLVGTFNDYSIRVWNIFDGGLQFPRMSNGLLSTMAISPGGDRIGTNGGFWSVPWKGLRRKTKGPTALVGNDGVIRFNRASDTTVEYNWDQDLVLSSPDGPQSGTTGARLHRIKTGETVGPPLQHSGNTILDVALSRDGRLAATSSISDPGLWEFRVGVTRIWDAKTGGAIGGPMPGDAPIAILAFSPDGNLLCGGDYYGRVHTWDTRTGRSIGAPLETSEIVFSLSVSPNGKWIAAGTTRARTDQPHVQVWSLGDRKPMYDRFLVDKLDWVHFLRFSPDSQNLLVGTSDQHQVWDLASGDPAFDAIRQGATILSMELSKDGREYATGDRDGTIRRYLSASGKQIGEPLIAGNAVQCLDYSPDRSIIAAGCLDGSTYLFDLRSGRPIGPAIFQPSSIHGISFAPTGGEFATTTRNGITRTWDLPVPMSGSFDEVTQRLEGWTRRVLVNGSVTHRRELGLKVGEGGEPQTRAKRLNYHRQLSFGAEQDRDWFGAQWHLTQLIRFEPENRVYLAKLGRALVYEGRWTKAEEIYQRLEATMSSGERKKAMLDHYRQGAFGARKTKHWVVADWYYRKILEVAEGSESAQLFFDRYEVLKQIGDLDLAQATYRIALARSLGETYAPFIANEWAREGNWASLSETYDRADTAGWIGLTDWHRFAISRLKAGDLLGYQNICKQLASRIGKSEVALAVGLRLARIYAIGPCAESSAEHGLAVLEAIKSSSSRLKLTNEDLGWMTVLKGGMHFRLSQFQSAVVELSTLSPNQEPELFNFGASLLKLAQQRVGGSTGWELAEPSVAETEDPWLRAELELLQSEMD